MTELIKELKEAGISIMPLKYQDGHFEHPPYSNKFDSGFSIPELLKLTQDGYSGGMAVMHGKCNPHIICLDFDEKNAPGKNLYDTWRHLIDQDLMMKLVIEKTRSSGYHVYFKCSFLPTTKALANSETGAEWIACRSSATNCITYCAPSPGYTEVQGSLFDLQDISPMDMQQLCDAASQLNEYKGAKTGKDNYLPIAQPPSEYSAIIRAFDYNVHPGWVPEYLQNIKWIQDDRVRTKPINGEKWEFVKMWRPGKDPRREPASANYWINKKRLSVFSSSTEFPYFQSDQSFSHTPSRVIYYTHNNDWNKTIQVIQEESLKLGIELPKELPLVITTIIGKKEVCKVNHRGVQQWAQQQGYCWLKLSTQDESVLQLIRVIDNVIFESNEKELVRTFVDYVDENYKAENVHYTLIAFQPSIMKYMDALPFFDGKIMRDTKYASYIYFSNGALRVTKDTTQLIKYSELDGCVFANHIKNFDYKPSYYTGAFGKFIKLISIDAEHERFIKTSLGYILHYYKLKNYAKALMIIEDVEDQEEARGRSGKGLMAQFIEWLRWTIQQDGRNYKSDSQFKMQRVVPGVQVFYMNDPAPTVLMGQFYNYISDDWPVEAKGKKSYSIPFVNSPKVLITTNYLPNIESDSDKDRFIILPIKKHFGASYTIRDEFPDNIFFAEDWNEYDREGAIRFAIECIQLYFKEGVTQYFNEDMKRNADLRVLKNTVPDGLVDTMEQAMELAKISKNSFEFEDGLEVFDLRKHQPETIKKAFGWEPGKLVVFVSSLYLYCMRAYGWKIHNGKVFGKWLRLYVDRMGYKRTNDTRNHSTGKRFSIYFDGTVDGTISPKSTIKNENDDQVRRDGYQPMPGNDDFF